MSDINFIAAVLIVMIGLYTVIAYDNLIKKIIGLAVFQTGIFIFYISLGKRLGGTAPILDPDFLVYSHPLPHVLILTAIVVGIAITAVGLSLIVRIYEAYGTTMEHEILDKEHAILDKGHATLDKGHATLDKEHEQ